jgi:hypothetical protein
VLVFVLFVLALIIIVVVGVSRRHRVAHCESSPHHSGNVGAWPCVTTRGRAVACAAVTAVTRIVIWGASHQPSASL